MAIFFLTSEIERLLYWGREVFGQGFADLLFCAIREVFCVSFQC
jgi:hypothetical protein